MKKSLLYLLLGGMLCTYSVNANAQESTAKEEAGIVLPQNLDYDVEPFVQYVLKAEPKAIPTDHDIVEAYANWKKYKDAFNLILAQKYQDILDKLDPDGKKRELFSAYVHKVLPLYAMQRAGRITPEIADDASRYAVDTVWAAPVDEIYYGLGDERNIYTPESAYGLDEDAIADGIANGGRVKHNQSYLWGLVTVGDKVYWCTNTNYLCVGGPGAGLGQAATSGDITNGYENPCWVCEFNSGWYGKNVHAKVDADYAKYSDTRIPRIYCYDTTTGSVEDITPYYEGEEFKAALDDCQGLRSAGTCDGVVFFGGPSLYGSTPGLTVGTQFFALDAETGKFISCKNMKDIDGNTITDIRRWKVVDGVLYCGVRLTDKNGVDCGAVLRWYGDKKDPWQFKIVGWMESEAAELEMFNGHMYVGGWNTNTISECTMIKGPEVAEGGLQPVEDATFAEAKANDNVWPVIWRYSQYDKNKLSANSTYTAGIMTWKGKLYFGTFAAMYTIPMIASRFYTTPEAQSSPEFMAFYLGSMRQTSFWSIDENDTVEMLFGESFLPYWKKFDKTMVVAGNVVPVGPDEWGTYFNGYIPKFGRAGYGQLFTAYSWTIEEYNGDMFVGTMNMENLVGGVAADDEGGNPMAGSLKTLMGVSEDNYGFELVRFTDPDIYPDYITTNGFGNGTAYGIRNFTKCNGDLYIGSASPLNLMPNGGCHLFRFSDTTAKQEEDIVPTGIGSAKLPGVIYKRFAGSVAISSLNGEKINNVAVYDAAGRLINNIAGKSNMVEIPTSGISSNVIIVKVKTAKGEWTREMVVK